MLSGVQSEKHAHQAPKGSLSSPVLRPLTTVCCLCLPGGIIAWPLSDNMPQQWLLLAACFWVVFMFMVASKFITLTFKDPDGRYASRQNDCVQRCSWAPRMKDGCPDQSLCNGNQGERGRKMAVASSS